MISVVKLIDQNGLTVMAYTRKNEKAKNAINSRRFATAVRCANVAYQQPVFVEDEQGFRIRVWGDGMHDYVRDEDGCSATT
jgi:hypothetical protein